MDDENTGRFMTTHHFCLDDTHRVEEIIDFSTHERVYILRSIENDSPALTLCSLPEGDDGKNRSKALRKAIETVDFYDAWAIGIRSSDNPF